MSIHILTIATDLSATERLQKSATKHGWELHIIQPDMWRGFGTKLIGVYEYLLQHHEIDKFVFCDAYDVVVMSSPQEFEEKLKDKYRTFFSSEKGCWPIPEWSERYDEIYQTESDFKYLNSGLYYTTRYHYIRIMEYCPPKYEDDDQLFFTKLYLSNMLGEGGYSSKNIFDIDLDYDQSLFNSHSFIADGEYTYENGRVQINGNSPIFIHSNARTFDPKLEELL